VLLINLNINSCNADDAGLSTLVDVDAIICEKPVLTAFAVTTEVGRTVVNPLTPPLMMVYPVYKENLLRFDICPMTPYSVTVISHILFWLHIISGLGYWHQRADERHGNPPSR